MKEAHPFLILLLLLLLPALASADISFEDVEVQGTALGVDNSQGSVQYLIPSEVIAGRPFSIGVLHTSPSADTQVQNYVIELESKGQALPYDESQHRDVGEKDQVQTLLVWHLVIDNNTEYLLRFGDVSRTVPVQARALQVRESRTLSRTDLNVQELSPRAKAQLRKLLRNYSETNNIRDYIYSEQQLDNLLETGRKNVRVTKESVVKYTKYEDNTTRTVTTFTIRAQPNQSMELLLLIEDIPKQLIDKASRLDYPLGEPVIIKEDPVVLWHLEDLDEKTVNYEYDGETDITGNTVILAATTMTTDEGWNWKKLLPPLIIIPLVGAIIIYFARYEPKR